MFKLTKKVIASALAVMSLAGSIGALDIMEADIPQLNQGIVAEHVPKKGLFKENWAHELQRTLNGEDLGHLVIGLDLYDLYRDEAEKPLKIANKIINIILVQ